MSTSGIYSTSELYSDEGSSSVESELEYSDDYELEVEEFDVATSASNEASGKSEDNSVAAAAAVFPYSDEPIADIEWVENYEREKESEKLHVEALQQHLDGTVDVSQWCKCGNCDSALLQNVYECQCCQEIQRCVENLHSEDVLQDTGTPPSCVTHHPGFRVNCLEKWSLRMSASKYRTKCHRRYRQSGSEESFLRSISYREFSQLVYGTLGRLRIPLPACVYQAIRTKFRENSDVFTGFDEDIDSD